MNPPNAAYVKDCAVIAEIEGGNGVLEWFTDIEDAREGIVE